MRGLHVLLLRVIDGYLYYLLPTASLYRMPIIANTNKMWIRLPTDSAKPKYPTSHPMIRITTINQIRSLMMYYFK